MRPHDASTSPSISYPTRIFKSQSTSATRKIRPRCGAKRRTSSAATQRRRIPPVRPSANEIAEHQTLGSAARHDRANTRRAAVVGKLRLRAWLKPHVAERHAKQRRADSMTSFVNASAPAEIVVHDARQARGSPRRQGGSTPPTRPWFASNSIPVAVVTLPVTRLSSSRGCQADEAGKITIGCRCDMPKSCRDWPRAGGQRPNDRKSSDSSQRWDFDRAIVSAELIHTTITFRDRMEATRRSVAEESV